MVVVIRISRLPLVFSGILVRRIHVMCHKLAVAQFYKNRPTFIILHAAATTTELPMAAFSLPYRRHWHHSSLQHDSSDPCVYVVWFIHLIWRLDGGGSDTCELPLLFCYAPTFCCNNPTTNKSTAFPSFIVAFRRPTSPFFVANNIRLPTNGSFL